MSRMPTLQQLNNHGSLIVCQQHFTREGIREYIYRYNGKYYLVSKWHDIVTISLYGGTVDGFQRERT